jgi:hypothetical protein
VAYNEGVGNQMSYNKESAWAVPTAPGTTYLIVRKLLAAAIHTDRSQIASKETNNRRAVTPFRLGTRKSRVSVPMQMFYAGDGLQFDDFIESWMCAAWVAAATAITAQTVTVGTPGPTTTFTAGTSIGDIAVGNWIKVTGFATTQIGNNGYFRVTAVNTLALTLATPDYLKSGMIAGASTGSTIVLQRMAYVKPGSIIKSLAFEEAQTDNAAALSVVKMALGAMANTFELNIVPDDIITATFEFMAKVFSVGASRAAAAADAGALNGTTVAASTTWTAAPTNSPMTANDLLMRIMVDNVAVGIVTNLKVNGNNGLEEQFPVGNLVPYALGKNDSVVTGTMDIYMLDTTYWAAYQNETLMGLSFQLLDPDYGTLTTQALAKGYAFDIPNIKLGAVPENKEKTKVLHNVQWSALELLTANTKGAATVNMVVSRLV